MSKVLPVRPSPGRRYRAFALPALLTGAILFACAATYGADPLQVNCKGNLTIECQSPSGAVVNYPADHCTATGGQPPYTLTFSPPSGSTFSLGQTAVTVTATDSAGNTATASFVVTVVDTTPPHVTASTSVTEMWPPNHKFINVGLSGSATDACDPNPTVTIDVFSNEDDVNAGNRFSPDAKPGAIFAPSQLPLLLRSERDGRGSGRIFLILVTAVDHSGNTGHACVAVTVPHDRSRASRRTVAAAAAAAVATCTQSGAAPAGFVPVGDGPNSPRH